MPISRFSNGLTSTYTQKDLTNAELKITEDRSPVNFILARSTSVLNKLSETCFDISYTVVSCFNSRRQQSH